MATAERVGHFPGIHFPGIERHRREPRPAVSTRPAVTITPIESEQGVDIFQRVLSERQKAKLEQTVVYARQLLALKIGAEAHVNAKYKKEKNSLNEIDTEQYQMKMKRTIEALFQFHDIQQLPKEQRREKVAQFQHSWFDESQEYENLYASLTDARERAVNGEFAGSNGLSLTEIILTPYQLAADKLGAIKNKIKTPTPEQIAQAELQDKIMDVGKIVNDKNVPDEQKDTLLEIVGKQRANKWLVRAQIGTGAALTGIFSVTSEPGGFAAAAWGATHQFVPSITDWRGIAAVAASYVGFYGASYIKAVRNRRLLQTIGWSNSGPAAAAFHLTDPVLPAKERDKITVRSDVGYYLAMDLAYGTMAIIPSATVAANGFGVAYTAGQIAITEPAIWAGSAWRKHKDTQKIKAGIPLRHKEDYKKQGLLKDARRQLAQIEGTIGMNRTTASATLRS